MEGGDGKHTRSSAPAQHCIHAHERGSAPAQAHPLSTSHAWGRVGKHTAQVHPLSTASTHAKEEAHLLKRTRSALHACRGGGGWGGAGAGVVSTPAQVHPLSTASTHAKEEAHLLKRTRSALHPRMRNMRNSKHTRSRIERTRTKDSHRKVTHHGRQTAQLPLRLRVVTRVVRTCGDVRRASL